MDTLSRSPSILHLGTHGFIQGSLIRETLTPAHTRDVEKASDVFLARYYGGVRYALPPQKRWRLARPLPPDYVYGTETSPAQCEGPAVLCPQEDSGTEGASEDCFQCIVWTPVGEPPEGGWPVIFYIHGGFLQFGSPNDTNVVRLLGETDLKCVIVAPVYRVAVLGFLSSLELEKDAATVNQPCGNQGFWDQRMALEWTREYAHFFGGNVLNITVAGYSAGSYSVFHQLAHDLYLPTDQSVIRQAIMFSNGPGVQPKSAAGAQEQFDELLTVLDIPLDTPHAEKLSILNNIPVTKLIDASLRVQHHQYRPWNDGHFISKELFYDIDNGAFAQRMIERDVRLMNGECRDEHFVYGTWHTPTNSLAALRQRLEADYPPDVCDALVNLYYPSGQLPPDCTDWQDAFGRIYADIQVHMLERGFANALCRAGASHLLYRYRIEYRVNCVALPPEWGVTHSSDLAMWLWGNGARLEEHEKLIVKAALIDPLVQFVNRSDVQWTDGVHIQRVRRLRDDGVVDVWMDEMWEKGVRVWEMVRRSQGGRMAKL
ncbi:putative carboxylesterase [Talaromyces proteolyticus]|uniref:Carboxylic ester hydrolase n=1 Tax=Talaromyces proteolyticus TaxID=1131652 RepID=A0AAD4PVM1_9EURO|nr:putative carboxylesterase [Talaromyces proteolyticus]KAH8693667.1 putative carboxylesterase [Talaromyces proteolyticus]